MDELEELGEERAPVAVSRNVSRVKLARAKVLRHDMTAAERLLWQALRANRMARLHFRRQQVISGFIVDFYCHAARVVVELGGAFHRDTGDYDAERDAILQAQGLLVLRFTNDQLKAGRSSALTAILTACVQRLPGTFQIPPPLASDADER